MNKNKSCSITIISVILLLTCLFISIISSSNAWFVISDPNRIQMDVLIEDVKFTVYQNSVSEANKINPLNKESYVTIDGIVEPDIEKELTLILKNEDQSGGSRYVRFKFEVMVSGTTTALSGVSITGYDETTIETNKFTKIGDYYYYCGTGNYMIPMEQDDQATMLTGFTVPYSAMKDLTHSESLKIVLTIETSDEGF